jgi:TPR repeat protein
MARWSADRAMSLAQALVSLAIGGTLLNQFAHGTWRGVFGLVVGAVWIGSGVAFVVALRKRTLLERRLRDAIDSGDADAAPKAASDLGTHFALRGDTARAHAAFLKAMDSGHRDAAPMAAFNLGLMRQKSDDLDAARDAYEQAVRSGHAEFAPKAAVNLAGVLFRLGDVDGARAACQIAIDSGHPEQTRLAREVLAHMRTH